MSIVSLPQICLKFDNKKWHFFNLKILCEAEICYFSFTTLPNLVIVFYCIVISNFPQTNLDKKFIFWKFLFEILHLSDLPSAKQNENQSVNVVPILAKCKSIFFSFLKIHFELWALEFRSNVIGSIDFVLFFQTISKYYNLNRIKFFSNLRLAKLIVHIWKAGLVCLF